MRRGLLQQRYALADELRLGISAVLAGPDCGAAACVCMAADETQIPRTARVRQPTGLSLVPARSAWPWIGKKHYGQWACSVFSALFGFPVPESVSRRAVALCALL